MPFANPFSPETFAFVRDLTQHNDRDWFQKNKSRYERDVKDVLEAQREIVDTIAAEVAGALSGQGAATHAGAMLSRTTGELLAFIPFREPTP